MELRYPSKKIVKKIWIPDIGHILVKYEKLSPRIRKIAEDIRMSDTRPILIKYDKLSANLRKMAEEI